MKFPAIPKSTTIGPIEGQPAARIRRVAKQATSAIPIVFGVANDPLNTGLVASLAHPGGNVTGLSLLAPELVGKRIELLRDVIPNPRRPAIMGNIGYPASVLEMRELRNRLARSIWKLPRLKSSELRTLPRKGSAGKFELVINRIVATRIAGAMLLARATLKVEYASGVLPESDMVGGISSHKARQRAKRGEQWQ